MKKKLVQAHLICFQLDTKQASIQVKMSNPDDLDGNLEFEYVSEAEVQNDRADGADDEFKDIMYNSDNGSESDEGKNSQKRVRGTVAGDVESLSKRQKKLKNSKIHERKREQMEYDIDQKRNIAKSSPEDIAEFFAKSIRENNPDLSPLELNDLYFKKSDFLSTANYEEVRNLTNFASFMTQYSKAPRCVIFSMSNMRVADIFRALNGSKNCLKLFAKNKLKDDLASVEQSLTVDKKSKIKSHSIRYFVATPTRMEKILDTTDLFFQGKDKLDIILDASYLDSKNNTLLKCENTKELCSVLKTILNKKSSVKILLY